MQRCILYANNMSVRNVQIRPGSDLYGLICTFPTDKSFCIQNTFYFGPTFVLCGVIRIQNTRVCIQIMNIYFVHCRVIRPFLTMHMAYKTSYFCTQICVRMFWSLTVRPCTDSCDISFVLCMWNDLYAYWRQIRGFFLYSACTQMFACKSFWCIDCHAKQHGAVC